MRLDYFEKDEIVIYKLFNETQIIGHLLFGVLFCYFSIIYLINDYNSLKNSAIVGLIFLFLLGIWALIYALIMHPRKFILNKKNSLYKVVHLILPITWHRNASILNIDYIHLWRAPEPLFKNKGKPDSTIALITKNKKVIFKERIEDFEIETKIKFLEEHLKVPTKEFNKGVYYMWA